MRLVVYIPDSLVEDIFDLDGTEEDAEQLIADEVEIALDDYFAVQAFTVTTP